MADDDKQKDQDMENQDEIDEEGTLGGQSSYRDADENANEENTDEEQTM